MDIYQGCGHDLALVKNGVIDKAQDQYVLLVDHNKQLAAAKAEIAKMVDALNVVVGTHAMHKGNEAAYLVSMRHVNEMIVDVLAKHKGE